MKSRLSTFDLFKNIVSDELIELSNEQVKKLQDVSIEIASDVIELCEKYNLGYTLGGGSALGAVRHGGFIPWDDDIDINITRKDIDQLIPIMERELEAKYWIHYPGCSDNYGLPFVKVRKKGTVVKNKDDYKNKQCGAGIDLFILENTYDSVVLRKIHEFISLASGFMLSCRNFYENRHELKKLMCSDASCKRVYSIKVAIGFIASILSVKEWCKITNGIYSMCKNNESKYVVIPSGRKHFSGEIYLRKDICESKKITFRDKQWNIACGVDGYLRKLYGSYKQIPPEDKREKHVVLEFKL